MAASTLLAEEPPSTEKHQTDREAIRQKFEERLKEEDAQLDKAQQQISAASTDKEKIEALSGAVTTLISQRKAMLTQIGAMKERLKERVKERKEGESKSGEKEAPATAPSE